MKLNTRIKVQMKRRKSSASVITQVFYELRTPSAIVDTTEVATGQILDATERVEAICQDVADTEQANAIRQAVTDIYESCNFQDLTGQRVRKVVDTLRNIDHRIAAICASFGLDATVTAKDGSVVRPPDIAAASVEELLNGPALPGEGMSQDDIDRMLAIKKLVGDEFAVTSDLMFELILDCSFETSAQTLL